MFSSNYLGHNSQNKIQDLFAIYHQNIRLDLYEFENNYFSKVNQNLGLRKGLDTVESLSAGAARDSNRNIGTVIIINIFVTFTHSNIDYHKLLMRILTRDLTFKLILLYSMAYLLS